MAHEFKMTRRVEFAETDMAGILHFANYFRYMEEVEHAFFRSLGLRVHAHDEDSVWGWARGQAECEYRRPLTYEDLVELRLRVVEKKRTSLTYETRFRLVTAGEDDPDRSKSVEVARGRIVAVCVGKKKGENRLRAIDIPPGTDAAIDVWPGK